jgi:hypothetical protein
MIIDTWRKERKGMLRTILSTFAATAMLFGAAQTASAQFLLIPESSNDTVGMYDPFDGSYMGDLIDGADLFSTPINAVLGPDGLIYVSDQVADSVFRFDMDGNFVDVFADDTDGLNNVRGIDFRDDELFVTSGDDFVARFASDGTRLTDFVNDGSDPFDIYFLDDGSALLADIAGSGDNIRLYNADGSLSGELFNVNFPEQINGLSNGNFVNAAFSADVVTEFDINGNIIDQWSFNGGRGVHELGNGNLLVTSGAGVFTLDRDTGQLTAIREGISARFIEFVIPSPGALALLGLAGFASRRRRR